MFKCAGNYRIVVFKDSHRLRQLCVRKIGSWKQTTNNRKFSKQTFAGFAGEGRFRMSNHCYDDDDDFILTKCLFKNGKN